MISNEEASSLSFSFDNSPFGRLVNWFRSIFKSNKSKSLKKAHYDPKEINRAKFKKSENFAYAYAFANYGIR